MAVVRNLSWMGEYLPEKKKKKWGGGWRIAATEDL